MRRKSFVILMVVALMAVAVATVGASSSQSGSYEGVFVGMIYGDAGSSAPITLDLTHRGNDVEGTVEIGSGLYVNGGNCGAGYVPAGMETAVGETVVHRTGSNPNRLNADASFTVSGFKVGLDLDGSLSADGETLMAEAKIDLPWLCGRDPVITGELEKQ